jgi:hypothetical protein
MAAAGPVLSPLELTRRRRAWAGWVRLGRLERAGLAVLALTTAVAVLAPLLAPYSPTTAGTPSRSPRREPMGCLLAPMSCRVTCSRGCSTASGPRGCRRLR